MITLHLTCSRFTNGNPAFGYRDTRSRATVLQFRHHRRECLLAQTDRCIGTARVNA